MATPFATPLPTAAVLDHPAAMSRVRAVGLPHPYADHGVARRHAPEEVARPGAVPAPHAGAHQATNPVATPVATSLPTPAALDRQAATLRAEAAGLHDGPADRLEVKAVRLEQAAAQLRAADRAFTTQEWAEHLAEARAALARAGTIDPDPRRAAAERVNPGLGGNAADHVDPDANVGGLRPAQRDAGAIASCDVDRDVSVSGNAGRFVAPGLGRASDQAAELDVGRIAGAAVGSGVGSDVGGVAGDGVGSGAGGVANGSSELGRGRIAGEGVGSDVGGGAGRGVVAAAGPATGGPGAGGRASPADDAVVPQAAASAPAGGGEEPVDPLEQARADLAGDPDPYGEVPEAGDFGLPPVERPAAADRWADDEASFSEDNYMDQPDVGSTSDGS